MKASVMHRYHHDLYPDFEITLSIKFAFCQLRYRQLFQITTRLIKTKNTLDRITFFKLVRKRSIRPKNGIFAENKWYV